MGCRQVIMVMWGWDVGVYYINRQTLTAQPQADISAIYGVLFYIFFQRGTLCIRCLSSYTIFICCYTIYMCYSTIYRYIRYEIIYMRYKVSYMCYNIIIYIIYICYICRRGRLYMK